MKKIKYLIPLMTTIAVSGVATTLAGCSCHKQITPELSSSSSAGVKIKESNIVKGQESTITLTIPEGKVIDTVAITIGNKQLKQGTDFTVSNNKITIKAEAVTGENVTITVITKSATIIKDIVVEDALDVALDAAEGKATFSAKIISDTTNGEKIKWSIISGSEYATIEGKTETESEETITVKGIKAGEATLQLQCCNITKTCTIDVGYTYTTIIGSDDTVYKNVTGLSDAGGSTDIKATPISGGTQKTWQRTNFNETVSMGKTQDTTGNYLLYYCTKFNKKIHIPNKVKTIGKFFLTTFNRTEMIFNNGDQEGLSTKPLIIPNSVESIDMDFLSFCTKFNQKIVIPNSVTSIGTSFLRGCSSFNNTIDLSAMMPDNVTIDSNTMLSNVPNTNTIKFKVAKGTASTWTDKLKTATGRDGQEGRPEWPSTWTIEEVE